MSKDIYPLKEPVELGKIIITELHIECRVKAGFHRVVSKPIPTEVQDGGARMVMHINTDGDLFDLMEAMTGQPRQVIDELGLDDYLYLRKAAEDMRANFPNSLVQPK